jgi:hypothetical protein
MDSTDVLLNCSEIQGYEGAQMSAAAPCRTVPPLVPVQDIGQELQLHAPPQGVDVVYEGVGGALRETLLRRLAPGGRLLQVGNQAMHYL